MDAIASNSISSINLSIYRYDPDSGKKPYMQDLSIDIPEGQDIMVLDLLNIAKKD
jgi:succinate dehydrogenase / fumarate reductase iron-sulfur subunit